MLGFFPSTLYYIDYVICLLLGSMQISIIVSAIIDFFSMINMWYMYIFKIKYIFKDLINNEYKHDKHIIQLFYFLLFIDLIWKKEMIYKQFL